MKFEEKTQIILEGGQKLFGIFKHNPMSGMSSKTFYIDFLKAEDEDAMKELMTSHYGKQYWMTVDFEEIDAKKQKKLKSEYIVKVKNYQKLIKKL